MHNVLILQKDFKVLENLYFNILQDIKVFDVKNNNCEFQLFFDENNNLTLKVFENDFNFFYDLNDVKLKLKLDLSKKKPQVLNAICGKKLKEINVFDASAGFLKDSLIFASRNLKVSAYEKCPLTYIITHYAIFYRSQFDNLSIFKISQNINFYYGNCIDFCKNKVSNLDVCYFDPMFAKQNKNLKVKKDMQILQIINKNRENINNAEQDFLLLYSFFKKVVVKRHIKNNYITDKIKPNYILKGKVNRFDVYLK